MDSSLRGKRALVCGASKGIGRAIAVRLAQAGAEVVALARDESALKSLMEELSGTAEHSYWAQDISKLEELDRHLKSRLGLKGGFQILVNNTGGPKAGPLISAEPRAFEDAFRAHVLSAQVLLQGLVPQMRKQKFGRVVNVISTSVRVPIPGLGVSNTIRAAMANWAKTMATELGPDGITVNNVLPGYTQTERMLEIKNGRAAAQGVSPEVVEKEWLQAIPLRRFGKPEEVADAVAFLVSPYANYINGINLPVDGGRLGTL
jgi:3-oxoacyl-[acyl-carrier protein] reductase